MTDWRFQKGELNIGCIFAAIVMLVVVVVAINVVPPLINIGELQNEIVDCADRANRRDYTDKRIVTKILDRAEELRLPVAKDNIKVKRSKSHIDVTVEYTLNIEIVFYTYTLHKVHRETRPLY